VRLSTAFPSALSLRSIGSAGGCPSLFVDFTAVGSEEAPRRACLRPPLKLDVQFSRIQLSQRRVSDADQEKG
jgi:hypothetical protein